MSAFEQSLAGRRVVVIGLGRSGVAASRACKKFGAEVIATDSAAIEQLGPAARALEDEGIRIMAGGHAGGPLASAELIVVSPGVPSFPELAAAEARGTEVIGEIELAARLLPGLPSFAITGSNGKSTTTLLASALATAAGLTPFVGGNLGTPPCEIVLEAAPAYDVLVLEISSFQAERVPTYRPVSVALLNVSDNHLDRYDGFDAYVRAKGNLFANQREGDVAVVPAGDARCLAEARRGGARVVEFGPLGSGADFTFDRESIFDRRRGVAYERRRIRLAGEHNALNVCSALALFDARDIDPERARAALEGFVGLPHRIAFAGSLAGVTYYDDSKGTNVGAVVAAIRGLSEQRVVLIAGGRDKLGSYDPLVLALRERGRGAVLMGEAADRIAEAIGSAVPVERASSMDDAVARASRLAQPGDAVLLSPACSSFDMFRDYKHRGEAFVDAVRRQGAALGPM